MAYGLSNCYVTDDVKDKLVISIRLERNTSKTAGDRDSVQKEHQQEMTYGLSNGHVSDVRWLHMTPKVLWWRTVGYPSDSLASCNISCSQNQSWQNVCLWRNDLLMASRYCHGYSAFGKPVSIAMFVVAADVFVSILWFCRAGPNYVMNSFLVASRCQLNTGLIFQVKINAILSQHYLWWPVKATPSNLQPIAQSQQVLNFDLCNSISSSVSQTVANFISRPY